MAEWKHDANNTSVTKKQKLEPIINYDLPFTVTMPSSQLRDLDLVQWLNNKLGDTSELWCGRQAASLLSREMLVELETCFQALEPHVKLKIVLAIPHLSYRLLTLWKEPIINLLDLARRDADDWVEMVANMYKDYPNRYAIVPVFYNEDSFFNKSLDELRKIVKNHFTNNNLRLLPPELCSVSQNAIKARFGITEIETRKHFNLKRRAKSSVLKAELLKSLEIACSRNKNQKYDVVSTSFPIRLRSTLRKPNNDLPMRGIPNTNTCKLSAGFTNEPRKFPRQLIRREGGAKFIEIGELPQSLSARRKELEAEERARKHHERELQRKRMQAEKDVKRATITVQKPKTTSAAIENSTSAMSENLSSLQDAHASYVPKNIIPDASVISIFAPVTAVANNNMKPVLTKPCMSYGDVREVPTVHAKPHQRSQETERELFAYRQCEEMLASANVLNEEGHRMVAAFMSGNKGGQISASCHVFPFHPKNLLVVDKSLSVHPYPHLGDVLTLKLSESYEDELRSDGTEQKLRVETFFQMDYRTGEWKRLRKSRAVRKEDMPVLVETFVHPINSPSAG
ncbi:unnamed protein product [Thelazia callipaeda]|uniref:HDAg domain-containing protein n=1 Tax=Thelazia callipaeda TaxID=103827 RepID=A0A0N5DA56_THECL|nr:unnamed protein product [Thelazia callipaeda]